MKLKSQHVKYQRGRTLANWMLNSSMQMSAYHANSLFGCKDTLDSTDQEVKNGSCCFMLSQCVWSEFQWLSSSTSDSNTATSNKKKEGHTNCVYKGGLISSVVAISGWWWAAEQMPLNQQTIMHTAVNKTKHLISPTVLLILLLVCWSHADLGVTFKRRSQVVYQVLYNPWFAKGQLPDFAFELQKIIQLIAFCATWMGFH